MNFKLSRSYIAIPLLLMAILAMLILPLPPWLIDALFTFNIVLAMLVLLVAVSAKRPLEFSVFPAVLLVATLMRLALNVASTRVVLLNGHSGPDAAGQVIQSFGEVVIGGNYVVGLAVFVILMIINFVVVTKGGERISEVSARFTLDAMPGKQMAIDADLNSGSLDQNQARQRRQEIAQEADFYGSMDGASKFVRGDAIAGLLILFINLLGGLAIGIFQHGLSSGEAFEIYALLTIGDGLVAQIPSLLLATAAAIIVTRVNDESEMTAQVHSQLLAAPRVIATAATIMAILGLIPGMPTLAFLLFAAVLGAAAWRQAHHQVIVDEPADIAEHLPDERPLSWQELPHVDKLRIELGYRLVPLADPEHKAELSARVRGIRKTLSEQIGVLLPEVRIRDNLQLRPTEYRIKLDGTSVASGEVDPDKLLAIESPDSYGTLDGVLVTEPAYQMKAVAIEPQLKARALSLQYSVVDSPTVISTHLGKIMRELLDEIFGHDDVLALNARLKEVSEQLAEALNAQLSPIQQLRVFRHLLADQVSLADIQTIATTLIDSAEITKDPVLLAADVRCALKRSLIRQINGERDTLNAARVANSLEETLLRALHQAQHSGQVSLDGFPVDPELVAKLQHAMPQIRSDMKSRGFPPILLVTPQLRPQLARYARTFAQGLKVISYNEVPERMNLEIVATLGTDTPMAA